MSNILITPILFHYDFLENLSLECAKIFDINTNNIDRYRQFKISIFLNFNRYLIYSLSISQAGNFSGFIEKLTFLIENSDENGVITFLNKEELLSKIKNDFLEIIKNIKYNK